jgi:hypothetical protein
VNGVEGGGGPAGPGTTPQRRSAAWRARRRIRRQASELRTHWEFLTDGSYRRAAKAFELPDGSKRIYCYHVRKTAGTSLFLSFLALGGEDPMDVWRRISRTRLERTFSAGYSFVSNNPRALAEGAYYFGRSHRPFTQQPLPPRTFTVTILRDPVDRVHSYFDYLVAGDPPDMPGQVANRERLLARDGFDAFLDRVPVQYLLTQLAMFSDRLDVSEATERIAGCSATFYTESYTEGLASLGKRLQIPLSPRHDRVTALRSSLTEEQTERLRTRLEPEYELLRRLDRAGVIRIGPGGQGGPA